MNEELTRRLVDWLEVQDLRSIRDLDELSVAIALQIAAIDRQFVAIVRQLLHNPRFQRLEASFRSIYELVSGAGSDEYSSRKMPASRQVSVFVLDISAEELQTDLGANSWKQTWVYDKLFRKRFDFLIGENTLDLDEYSAIYPFSLMLVDFDFTLGLGAGETSLERANQLDLTAVTKLARIGESCFCMFLMSLAPSFFGDSIKSFRDLENVIDVGAILRQPRYAAWKAFRELECSRMVGLAMPRVLVRKPYRNHRLGGTTDADGKEVSATGIRFDEHDGYGDCDKMLWGRASFAVVQPMIRSFKQYDWFADVCGVDRDPKRLATSDRDAEGSYDGGLIDGLPQMSFRTDTLGVASYSPTEIVISERGEAIYSALGLIPVFSINQSPYIATLSCQSVQEPREMSTADATSNLRLSSMFNYMLCVCRMAHRLKIESRSQIGRSIGPEQVQDHMQSWLMEHTSGQNRGLEQKMVKPFFDENTGFFVYEDITDPGRYDCTIRLCPHHKYDSGRTRLIFEPVTMKMQLNANEDAQ